jgi:hypothetical protein
MTGATSRDEPFCCKAALLNTYPPRQHGNAIFLIGHIHFTMAPNLTLFSVNAILILSTDDSSRIFAKYYHAQHPPHGTPAGSANYPGANPYPTLKDQKAFEKGLLEKTVKQTSDVILYDNRVVLFKQESDIMLVCSRAD